MSLEARLGPRTALALRTVTKRAGRIDWIAHAAALYGESATVDDIGKLARAWTADNVDLYLGDRIAQRTVENTARRFIARLIARPELAEQPYEARAMSIDPQTAKGLAFAGAAIVALLFAMRSKIAAFFLDGRPAPSPTPTPAPADDLSCWVTRCRCMTAWADDLDDANEAQAATALRDVIIPAGVRAAIGGSSREQD